MTLNTSPSRAILLRTYYYLFSISPHSKLVLLIPTAKFKNKSRDLDHASIPDSLSPKG